MKQKFLLKTMLLLCALVVGVSTAWADVVSGTTYDTKNTKSLPEGWSGSGSESGSYMQLTASVSYIQTSIFLQNGFTSIKVKARKYGGPSDAQALITVSWYDEYTSAETVLGTITPTNTTLTDYTISSPTNPTGNTTGYVKIQCKDAGSAKGSGVSQVTITYTAAAPDNTINVKSNNESYGTVSLNGSVMIGSPKSGYRYADPAYTVSPENSATVTQNGNTFTVIPSANTTITINFEPIPSHTAHFSVNGTIDNGEDCTVIEGSDITFPSDISDVNGKKFVGWLAEVIDGTTNEKPEFVTSATMGNSDVTYYAVFAAVEGESGWIEADLSDMTASDVFVFSNGSYAMTNDNSTSNAPAVSKITTVSSKITSDVTDNLKWKVTGNSTDGYVFYPNGSTTTWLYCTTTASSGSNNNIRVGNGDRKLWVFNNNGYIVTNDKYTNRYLSLYSSQDFRGYINTTNGAFVPKFYKYSNGIVSDYCTSVVAAAVEKPVITLDANPFLFSTTATITCATEGATIKYSYDGENWNDYTEALTITATTTIYAKAIKGVDESSIVQVTATKNLAEPTVTISATDITNTNVFTGTAAGSLAASVTYNDAAVEGAAVTWSGNKDEVATIDPSTGAVTLVAAGSVTFTATYAGNGDYSEKAATYEMTVTNSDPNANDGSAEKPYATMDEIFTASAKAGNYYVTLDNWVVSGVNGNQAFVTDNNGKGFIIYKSGHGFAVGDILSGTVQASLTRYKGAAEFTSLTSETSGLTVTTGGTLTPQVVTIDELSGVNTGAVVQVKGVSYNGTYLVDGSDNSIKPYTTLYSGTYTNGKEYNVTGIYVQFDDTKEILPRSAADIVENVGPSITVASSLAVPNYVIGTTEPTYETLTVNGSNLTADITLSLGESSNFEMSSDLDNWTNSLTLTQSEGGVTDVEVAIRLKAGLAKGAYEGTLTLSSTGADNAEVSLSGSVTGQTYAIEQYTTPATAHGTITFSPASPVEDGTEVTLSAEPAEGYTFTADSWVIYKQSGEDYVVDNSITVTANKFNMPAYAIWVDGTFNAKPTYAITCVADPIAGGEIISDLGNAFEGQTVTLSYSENTGYKLSSIVITKTSDGSATGITPTVSGDDYTFTMPGYAVTATATYKEVYTSGTFAKYSSAITEGYYVITYGNYVLKNTISSNRFDYYYLTDKDNIKDNMFTDPDPSIVWYIKPNGNYWTLYNDAKGKFAAGTGTKNQGSLIESVTDFAKWTVTMSNGTFQFENLGRYNASSDNSNRWLRNNAGSGWACYASGTGGALTLYKMTVLTPRTITFEGNGGTYNEATTYTQDVYDGVEATLNANKFTRDGYEFIAWNNQADGNGATSRDDGEKITVTGSDLSLYAQWAPLYTLTIDDAIEGGSVSVEGNITSAVEDTEITLTYTASAGHKFSAWNVYKEGDTSTKVTVTDNKFAMPNYNVVISATFEEVPTYSLVTDVNDIVPGKHYIIASGTNGSVKAMGNQNTNYRNVVSVTASNGIIPETDGVFEFVIYGPNADGNYTIYDAKYNSNAGGYLYANSRSSNNMGTQDSNDANGKWSIEIANTGSATINAQGTNTRNCMRFNGDRFSCYASTTSVSALPYLFVKDGDTPVATTASVKLNAYGYATFASTDALDFLDADAAGIEYSAWQITGISGDAITFSQIKSTVAAGEGILLKGTPNATINLNVLPIGGETLGDNKLEGITTATAIVADTYYGLKDNMFVKVNAGTIPAGKALLPASEIPSGARELNFVFEGEQTTSVSEECRVKSEEFTTATIFDLQGRKVTKPQKGLYIVNGRKVVVK